MNKDQEKALRLKIRAEEQARAQKLKDDRKTKEIRAEERLNATEGGPLERMVRSTLKKGFKEVRKEL